MGGFSVDELPEFNDIDHEVMVSGKTLNVQSNKLADSNSNLKGSDKDDGSLGVLR